MNSYPQQVLCTNRVSSKIWRAMELGNRTRCPYEQGGDIKTISQSMQTEEIKESEE